MEDKSINDINNALNSLQKDEEQIKQEIEKLQGKYEFENGKFVEPKEVTQYKKDLERVQKEIEEKTATREQRKLDEEKLTERENNLIEEKANLEDENRIKYLKNLYRNNPEAYEMIDKKLEERRRRIDFKLSEIEKIRNLPESERANIDIDEWLKEAEERNLDENYEKKTEPREEEIGEKTLEVDEPIEPEEEAESQEENEEQIEPEEEAESQKENEEETKQMLVENIDKEIDKINQVLKKYEELENEINELSEPFDVDMEQKINSQKKEFKDLKLSIGKLSIKKQTLEAMKELVEKDVKQAKKEYEEYENKSEENDKEIEQIEETIERLILVLTVPRLVKENPRRGVIIQDHLQHQDTDAAENQHHWSGKGTAVSLINVIEGHKRIKGLKNHLIQLLEKVLLYHSLDLHHISEGNVTEKWDNRVDRYQKAFHILSSSLSSPSLIQAPGTISLIPGVNFKAAAGNVFAVHFQGIGNDDPHGCLILLHLQG